MGSSVYAEGKLKMDLAIRGATRKEIVSHLQQVAKDVEAGRDTDPAGAADGSESRGGAWNIAPDLEAK